MIFKITTFIPILFSKYFMSMYNKKISDIHVVFLGVYRYMVI